MIWVALIIALILVVLLQVFSSEKSLEALEADAVPGSRLAEPEAPLQLRITVNNRGRLPISYVAVRGKLSFAPERQYEFSSWLLPRQKLERSVEFTAPGRGRYVLESFRVRTGDFLGLKEAEKVCGSFREIVVMPKRLSAPALDSLVGGFLGDISVRRFILEDPVLTMGYREYSGAEPMKRIAWSQSARRNELMVKKNDYTVEPSVSVVLNVHTDLEDPQAQEHCFCIARSVCELLEKKGIRYSFVTNARQLGYKAAHPGVAGLGQQHFHAILEVLGRACPEHTYPFAELLTRELQQTNSCGHILITPGGSETALRLTDRLRESGGLLLIKGTEAAQWY